MQNFFLFLTVCDKQKKKSLNVSGLDHDALGSAILVAFPDVMGGKGFTVALNGKSTRDEQVLVIIFGLDTKIPRFPPFACFRMLKQVLMMIGVDKHIVKSPVDGVPTGQVDIVVWHRRAHGSFGYLVAHDTGVFKFMDSDDARGVACVRTEHVVLSQVFHGDVAVRGQDPGTLKDAEICQGGDVDGVIIIRTLEIPGGERRQDERFIDVLPIGPHGGVAP